MCIGDFLKTCRGDVRVRLTDGSIHRGHFRTDIVTPAALSAYFFGCDRDISLPLNLIESIEHVENDAVAS